MCSKKLVKPAAKRTVVQHLQKQRGLKQHGLSQRRANCLVQCNQITARYISHRRDDSSVRARLRELASDSPALDYRMLYGILRLEGWEVNHKRIYRLYCEEEL